MIRFLQRQKAKKGFTIIELIVVVAIIGVLSAIIFPMIAGRRSRIQEANSAARDFYTAMQSVMTKFTMFEGPLSPAYLATPDLGEMRYFELMGGNYPYMKGSTAKDTPNTTSLYVEFTVENSAITDVYTNAYERNDETKTSYDGGQGLYDLCNRIDEDKEGKKDEKKNTEFGRMLRQEIENRIKYQDGYYYAKVTYKNILTPTIPAKMEAETVKVEYTGYCKKRLPDPGDLEFNSYKNANLYFGEDNVLVNGNVFGVCAPLDTDTKTVLGFAGTTLN